LCYVGIKVRCEGLGAACGSGGKGGIKWCSWGGVRGGDGQCVGDMEWVWNFGRVRGGGGEVGEVVV